MAARRATTRRKPLRKQEAPLKPEYQARFEASMKDQDRRRHGLDLAYSCLPQGMPRMMSGVARMEFLISPGVTHILFERNDFAPRRIYTDGRDWPETRGDLPSRATRSASGSIPTATAASTRSRSRPATCADPRTWDQSGMPMADDDEGVIKERLFLDKDKPEHPARRDDHDRQLADAAVDGDEDLSPRAKGRGGRIQLHRGPTLGHHRQGGLFPQRRRHDHADQEEPAAAGFEIFQSGEIAFYSHKRPYVA